MNETLTAETLQKYLAPIIETCPLWKGKNLSIAIIANPKAGGFTNKKRIETSLAILKKEADLASKRKRLVSNLFFQVIQTQYAGHAVERTLQIIAESLQTPDKNFESLIITASGDGTSLEVQTALMKACMANPENKVRIMSKIAILRLPFGTGNDGSDDRTLDKTLRRLTTPSHFAWQRAIKVYYEGKTPDEIAIQTGKDLRKKFSKYGSLDDLPPWYAFNIASIGIDAYITYMTNKTKSVIPGDFYRLWADLACVFYGFKFPPGTMEFEFYDQNNQLIEKQEKAVEFALLGVSGHRQYGSNYPILPHEENFCSVEKMSLIRKLKVKPSFNDGSHYDQSYTQFVKCEKIKINYNKNILVQMDGEVHLLQKDQFPLIMERTEPIIRIIECDDAPHYRGAEIIKLKKKADKVAKD